MVHSKTINDHNTMDLVLKYKEDLPYCAKDTASLTPEK